MLWILCTDKPGFRSDSATFWVSIISHILQSFESLFPHPLVEYEHLWLHEGVVKIRGDTKRNNGLQSAPQDLVIGSTQSILAAIIMIIYVTFHN